jgi:hypothetical protein
MPLASEYGDGVTVVEGPTASIGYAHAQGHVASGSSRGKGAELSSETKSHTTFAKTSDYFSEERPFVVLIGKKGVIGALQELDQLLRTVCLLLLRLFPLLMYMLLSGYSLDITRFSLIRWVIVTVARALRP